MPKWTAKQTAQQPENRRSAIPVLSLYAVHSALQSSFQAQYSTTHQAAWVHRLGDTSLEDWATRPEDTCLLGMFVIQGVSQIDAVEDRHSRVQT